MTISLKHAFTCSIPDGSNTDIVRPSDWNAEHEITMATARLLGRLTAGDGAVEELEASAVVTFLGLVIGTDVQAWSTNLDSWSALDPADFSDTTAVNALIAAALTSYYTSAQVDAGFQPLDAQLTSLSSASANGVSLVTAADYAAMRALLDLQAGTDFYSIAAADAAFQPLDDDLTSIAALSTTSFGRSLLESASASALYGAIKQTATEAATGASEWATTAEVRAASAAGNQVIRVRSINEASALVTLTDAATVAVNWTAGVNFTLTITANRILGNPTNEIPGTFRTVFVIASSGTRTLTFDSEYGGTPPTLADITTTKGYLLTIYCRAAGQFIVTAVDGSPA